MNKRAVEAMRDFLEALGIAGPEMAETPERVAQMYEELFSGVGQSTEDIWGELFEAEGQGLVAIKDIAFHSMCEHHLLPFFGKVAIVYKPRDGKVAGFGRFARLVEMISKRPQLQERMTEEIAEAIMSGLKAEGVLVITKAHQLCMSMRGSRARGTSTMVSAARGVCAAGEDLAQQAWYLAMGQEKDGSEYEK